MHLSHKLPYLKRRSKTIRIPAKNNIKGIKMKINTLNTKARHRETSEL
jgi:hypothetical protein